MYRSRFLWCGAVLLLATTAAAQVSDEASLRANDRAFDAADEGVGAAARNAADVRRGVPAADEAAAQRTFGAPESARIDSPEGTLQEEGALVEGLVD